MVRFEHSGRVSPYTMPRSKLKARTNGGGRKLVGEVHSGVGYRMYSLKIHRIEER